LGYLIEMTRFTHSARGEGTVTTVGVRCTVYDAVEVAIAISVQAELRVSAST